MNRHSATIRDPGEGRVGLITDDISCQAKRDASHIGQGTMRGAGINHGYGDPWFSVTMLQSVTDRESARYVEPTIPPPAPPDGLGVHCR